MKKQTFNLIVLLVVLVVVSATTVLAYTYRATYTISENGTASYDMLPVWVASNNQFMVDNGFLTADALDSRIETLGGLVRPHMVVDNMTLTAVAVPTNSQTNLYFTTGNSLLSAFDIIVGRDGYITTSDHADLELGDNFTVEQTGWVDTTLGTPGTDVLHFDGSASAASNVNCGASYNATPKLWLSFWFRLDANHGNGDGDHYLWGKYKAATDYVQIALINDGKLKFWKYDGGGASFTLLTTSANWTADTWYHVIASVSSAAGARLRVDNGTAVTDADTSAVCDGGDFVIGDADDPGGGTTGFVGEICDFVAGTDDLSDAEETALYSGSAPGDETDYWFIDEGSGTTIYSYGSAGNDGTADTDVSWETSVRPVVETIRRFVQKLGAFQSYVFPSGNITSRIYGGTLVTATSVSSGEHTVKTYGEANKPIWATGDVLHFDGTAGSVIDAGAIYDAATELWFSFWFKLDANYGAGDGTKYFLFKDAGGSNKLHLNFNSGTGAIDFRKWTGVGSVVTLSSGETSWTGGQWYHIITSCSSTLGMRLRIDNGTPVTSVNTTAICNGGTLFLGNQSGAHGNGPVGIISNWIAGTDDLSDAEETALYNGLAPGDETDYWYIDEGTGTNIVSYGSQANAGTAGGAPDTTWATSTYTGTDKTGRLCDFVLSIDDTTQRAGANLKGVSVTNNANDWRWNLNNSLPYCDNITVSVNGTERLRYEPITYIIGDNLPDLTGTSQNGTFTWGTNPTGVTVALGGMVSSAQPAPGVSVSRPAQDILPEVEVSDWFLVPDVSGTLLTNPMRPFVTMLSDTTDLTEIQSWRLLALAFIFLVTLSTARGVRGHHFITGVACGASMGGMVALTIFPMWALVFIILPLFAGLIAERSPSL